ncbi:hypothetical protein [Myxosarcina sp. GI1(2024)]
MQYEDLPLFILLSAAIYLTAIYGILIVAKKLLQKDNLIGQSNIKLTENNIRSIIILAKQLSVKWIYDLFDNSNYHQKNLSKFFIYMSYKVSLKTLQHVDYSN